jgi:hypothetical protein
VCRRTPCAPSAHFSLCFSQKNESNLAKTGQERLSKSELNDRAALVDAFKDQMTTLKDMMASGAKKRSRPKKKKLTLGVTDTLTC